MGSIPEAAIAASVIVGLVSIPAASQSVNTTGKFTEPLPNISNTEEVPQKVVQETSPDGFSAKVRDAFQKYATEVTHDQANASLENPSSNLKVRRTPGKTLWVLETPEASLKISETPQKTREVLESPEGTLEKVRENGGVKTSYTGDRKVLKQLMNEMRQKMKEKRQSMKEKSQELKKRNTPTVEIKLNESLASTPEEKAVIVNRDTQKVNLDGWKLTDGTSSYEFGNIEIGAGEKLEVLSDDDWRGNDASDISWTDSGDTGRLFNEEGVLIDETTY